MKFVDVCFSPMLYRAYHDKESIAVVVDIFRASTTICTALNNGAASLRTVATVEEAQRYKEDGWLVGAERNVKRCDFADFGNDPFEYTPTRVKNKDLVFTTTNGTRAVKEGAQAAQVIIGAFVNFSSTINYLVREGRNVLILCSGWKDKVNIEDTIYGGSVVEELIHHHGYQYGSDGAKIAEHLWLSHKENLSDLIQRTDHIKRLINSGLESAVPYCLSFDKCQVVPLLEKEENALVFKPNKVL